jgi:pyruvate/2-oxoglutarate dehydrogenase complex dihydrolipoamide acyltransferase (E2) component
MRTEIAMPAAGSGMESGKITRWLKEVGSEVRRGEPVVEIETDKATLEIEARASGVLVEIVQPAGAEVPVGTTIGYLES